jgi:hypothetical protein
MGTPANIIIFYKGDRHNIKNHVVLYKHYDGYPYSVNSGHDCGTLKQILEAYLGFKYENYYKNLYDKFYNSGPSIKNEEFEEYMEKLLNLKERRNIASVAAAIMP